MTEKPTEMEESAFPGRWAAVGLAAGLLLALLVALAVAMKDNARRATLETTAEFTAVGDNHYFPMPQVPPVPPYEAVASFHGQPLYPTDYRRHESAADDMSRAGVDEKAGYIIYRAPQVAKDDDERMLGPVYFLKISPTEYLKVREGKK
ncbi:MAG TPA: hypothetical protein VGM54_10895 [Chthoniobacter sp.]|jgi:hypothetical protein